MSVKPGFYRHYKGGLYCVLLLATDEATRTPLVIYQGTGGETWARPLVDFEATVTVNGKRTTRFVRVSPEGM